MSRVLVGALFVSIAVGTASAQEAIHHGKLSVLSPGRGTVEVDVNSSSYGSGSFRFRNWGLVPSVDSNGISPATEPIAIFIGEERFMVPSDQLKVSRKGKRFVYRDPGSRGVRLFKLVQKKDGTYRVSVSLAGVDLSVVVIRDEPQCISFAIIIGDDDGFSGVSFVRPRPAPSRLLKIPGFCTQNTDWPWA